MATSFKTFLNSDTVTSKTLLHEAIPITGSIVSGSYADNNVKNYSHGMFQGVYDYPYLSSSANHIFDVTYGFSTGSGLSSSVGNQQAKKSNVYNQMAQLLAGYDASGDIREFDEDGNLSDGAKLSDCIFINFSRLLVKDEIKKGSFEMVLGMSGGYALDGTMFQGLRVKVADTNASTNYRTNSPAGEYGVLTASNDTGSPLKSNNVNCGLIFYQAGIVALTASLFNCSASSAAHQLSGASDAGLLNPTIYVKGAAAGTDNSNLSWSAGGGTGKEETINAVITGSNIETFADSLRQRIYNVSFNNTTELNSSIYFCRANHNEFNYSSNPTYTSGSKIQVKTKGDDLPVTYVTTVGLYSADNELLAVAKLSEPIRKDPTTELTFRVRLDY
jgi:hypothetical protein